jgi:DNA adenine methylase
MVEDIMDWKGNLIEPFCGMLGVGIHFAEQGRSVLANDVNKDLILLLKAIKIGWNPPPECSRKRYNEYRVSNKHSAERGFYGFACAYSGIFFAGYRIKCGERNFFNTFRKSLLKMKPALQKVKFSNKSYDELHPKGMTVYCDPPYSDNSFGTEHFDDFNFEHFWQTMREWSKDNLVFVSEYTAPDDFTCVWEKELKSGFSGSTERKKRAEKLFMYINR